MYSFDFIEESYTILNESLSEVLKNKKDLFSPIIPNDFLSGLIGRINTYKQENATDLIANENLNQVIDLEMNVYGCVLKQFKEDFDANTAHIDYLFQDLSSARFAATLIYDVLYVKRRNMIVNFLLNSIIANKKDFIAKYKKPENRKDIQYQNMREQLKLKKPDHYSLIMFCRDICKDIVTDTSDPDIDTIIDMSEIDLDDSENLKAMFGSDRKNFSRFFDGMDMSDSFNSIVSEVKNNLIKILD